MPINRTEVYICDGCGREIGQHHEKYQTLLVEPHNYSNLIHDECGDTYVYCDRCVKYMWRAVLAIPKIVEASNAGDGNADAT